MSKTIVTQVNQQSQVTLKSGKKVNVPEGADPEAFRKFAQAKEDRAKSPKKTRRTSPPRSTKRLSASQALARLSLTIQREAQAQATIELVERVNGQDDDKPESIFITAGEDFQVLEVAR